MARWPRRPRRERRAGLDLTASNSRARRRRAAEPPPCPEGHRTRLLFSCLVDADWLNSAAAVDPGAARQPPLLLDRAEQWLSSLLRFIEQRASKCLDPTVAACRDEVLRACLRRADEAPGIFTLTVPTGGGKTLSALAFALRHAIANGLRRINLRGAISLDH